MKKIFLVIFLILFSLFWVSAQPDGEVIKGLSLESPPFELNGEDFEHLTTSNANWLAVIPYGFSRYNTPQVSFNSDRQWWGEKVKGAAEMIKLAREKGYKVMLKPQVWIFRGWVGNYGFDTEGEWIDWENSYRHFILTFAHVADSLDVELFCLGTEYKRAVEERPEFWFNLIDSVRSVYSGQLTYAANWDEYALIEFWDKLDYIGIDAYFPLSEKQTPKLSELLLSWVPIKLKMKRFSEAIQKPVLLTEFGYRSVDKAAGKQWNIEGNPVNFEVQEVAYLALFESLWSEDWICGGFLWKWKFRSNGGGINDKSYSPQGKPAMEVIQDIYSID